MSAIIFLDGIDIDAVYEEFSDIFKKLTDTNSLVAKSVKPTTMEEAEFFLSAYVSTFNTDKYSNHKKKTIIYVTTL